MRAKVTMPTKAEEARIQQGIAQDPDNPEWSEADFAAAKPAQEAMPDVFPRLPRRRGRGKVPAKVVVSLRLRPEIRDKLRGLGPGWQTWAAEVLTQAAESRPTMPARRTAEP